MRFLRFVPVVLVALPVLVFVLAGAPPVLRYVKDVIERAAGDGLSVPLVIGHLEGNLFYSLRAEDVMAQDLGRVGEMTVSYNIFGLLRRRIDIKRLDVRDVELDIDRLLDVLAARPRSAPTETTTAAEFRVEIGRFSIDGGRLRKRLGRSDIDAAVHATGRLAGELLTLDTLRLTAPGSAASARGIVPLNAHDSLDITYDIRLALALLALDGVEGGIEVGGTVSGPYSRLWITADGTVGGRFGNHDLTGQVSADWHVPDLERLEVKAGLRLMVAFPAGAPAARTPLDVELDLERSRLAVRITSDLGAARLAGTLERSIDRPRLEGRVQGRLTYAGFNPSFEGPLSFKDGIVSVQGLKITSPEVAGELKARLDLRSNEILDGRVTVTCRDLSVARYFNGRLGGISGRLRFDMNVRGALQAPSAEATLTLAEVTFHGEKIDSVALMMSADRGRFALEQGWIESERGRVEFSGRYDPGTGEFNAALGAPRLVFSSPVVFGADTVRAGAVVSMDLLFSGDVRNPGGEGTVAIESLVYDTFALGDHYLEFSFADTTLAVSLANSQQSISLDAEAFLHGNMPFAATLKARHFMVDDYFTLGQGQLTADLAIQGDLSRPEDLSAWLRVDTARIRIEESLFENTAPVTVRLAQRMVTIETCDLAIAGQPLRVQGQIPLEPEHGRLDLHAATPSIELSDIAGFLPAHPRVGGSVQFDLRVRGATMTPDIEGRLTLVHGHYEDAHVRADSVTCRLAMTNNVIRIEELAGRINRGRFRVDGAAVLAPGRLDTLSVQLAVEKAQYVNRDFGKATVSADIRATGRRDSLQVAGEIIVDDGVYDVPVRLQSIVGLLTAVNRPEPQQPDIMKRIYCDIGISVPDRFRISNNVADLAARADLQVKGYLARLNVYGTIMAVGPGTVQYLGRKFQIVSGVIAFDDPYRIDPAIDLAAGTSVTTAEGNIDIYLLLTGTTTDWQLELSSNPPLPEQDIVSLLLIGRRRPGEVSALFGEIDLKGKARDFAFDAIRHGIEKSTQDLLGLDKFTLTGDLGEPMTMRIGVEKSISRGFTLTYTTGIESWEMYQIGARYDLTDQVSIHSLHDQENLNTSIDLNFRFRIR